MGKLIPALSRRELMAGLGASLLGPALTIGAPLKPASLALKAGTGTMAFPGRAAVPIWQLSAASPGGALPLGRGERIELSFTNDLPAATALAWYGLDGASSAEPLTARQPTAPGGTENLAISTPHAGTLIADIRLLEDGKGLPARPFPLVVPEGEPVAVDRDEVILLEDWRLSAEGAALAPGSTATDASPFYTVNGQVTPDLAVRPNERLRLRFINGCHRAVIAIKIESHEVLVMALDGQPAEPFLARNGAVVLAPGGRCDAFIDTDATAQPGTASPILLHDGREARAVARLVTSSEPPIRPAPLAPATPLPENGLPARLDLRGAARVDVPLGGARNEWMRPVTFSASAVPAFSVKQGRTVVLTLSNQAAAVTVFHLHGHHFRVLDRLDDGWKPFWLDTLAIEPGQTQRIAFAATYAGRWLIEFVGTDWTAPRLVRWYAVE